MRGKHNRIELNIAMIGHKRIPSREGGIEIVVEELAVRMVQLGNKVTVYNRKGHHVSGKEFDSDIKKNNNYKDVKIVTVPTIECKGLAALTSSFFSTIKAIFGRYDVIHYHAEGPAVMIIIPHLFKIRTIVTIHGLDWQRAKWSGIAIKYLKYGEKIAAKYADEVIVLSENVKKYFMDTYGRDVTYIPNGINKPNIKEVDIIREKWNLEKDSYILFLGRIVPEKGLQYLINAYCQLDTSKKLVIAGGASDTNAFMDDIIRKVKNNGQVILTGFVQGIELEELYSNAYIYVLPSDIEGMPISLLEAMSYGNCCVVSDISECTEVVEDNAVIFKRSNSNDLRLKLMQLCNNSTIVENYKKKASDYIINKYNWNDVVDETLKLYMKDCKSKRGQ